MRPFLTHDVVGVGAVGSCTVRSWALVETARSFACHLRPDASLVETAELLGVGSHIVHRLDVTSPAAIDSVVGRVVDELGRLDILVNNAVS